MKKLMIGVVVLALVAGAVIMGLVITGHIPGETTYDRLMKNINRADLCLSLNLPEHTFGVFKPEQMEGDICLPVPLPNWGDRACFPSRPRLHSSNPPQRLLLHNSGLSL